MSLTVTNQNTLQLLNILNRTSTRQSNVLTQLSTGLRINKASDDPAGLIAMENFNAELTAANTALDNNQKADAMLGTADAALGEVTDLLNQVESLALSSVNDTTLSAAEVQANQAQIDDALNAIDRIANTTTFNGRQLLNGAQAIQTAGLDPQTADNLRIFSRGASSSDFEITATVKTAAAKAKATITLAGGAKLTEETEIVIAGTEGTATVTLGTNDTRDDIRDKINVATAQTGVTAAASGNNVELTTAGTGSDESVSLTVLSGGTTSAAPSLTDLARAEGTDAVVTINGRDVTADGSDVSYSANGYSFSFTLGANLDAAADTETFTIKAAGGMTFQLGSTDKTRSTLGVDSVASHRLGNGDSGTSLQDIKSGGSADLQAKSANTLKAVREAITQVASLKGRIGGFQRFQVQTTINSLNAQVEALTAAKSVVADTDFAEASAELNRQSVLLNSGISLLGLANQQASQILALLG